MSIGINKLSQIEQSQISTTIRNAGVSGAGGAGFPAYAKWDRIDEVDALLVNHQESEPNYYMDKWLGQKHADELAILFDGLLDSVLDVIVIGAKAKDRDEWMAELEASTGGEVYEPDELPLNVDDLSGVVFAYTDDQYEYGMESVILQKVANVVIGKDLPMDHGWMVHNTESLYNIYRAIETGNPVTHKYVHVDGEVPRHRFLKVPIGTPASALLKAAGTNPDEIDENQRLLDGGPGWCFEIDRSPERFGLRKRSNCLLVANADTVEENIRGNDRVDIREPYDWKGTEETEPTATLSPPVVRIPLITNPAFEGIVSRSQPIVEKGEHVTKGEMIATPGGDGMSNTHHASIDGEITAVSDTHIEIQNENATTENSERSALVYWTWCIECGTYVVHPDIHKSGAPKEYVCEDCR